MSWRIEASVWGLVAWLWGVGTFGCETDVDKRVSRGEAGEDAGGRDQNFGGGEAEAPISGADGADVELGGVGGVSQGNEAGAPTNQAGASVSGSGGDGGSGTGAAGEPGTGDAGASGLTFSVTPLGELNGLGATSYGLNDAGDVVGRSNVDATTHHPFLWQSSSGQMTDLGRLGSATTNYGEARGINNHGLVTGAAYDGGSFAFTWLQGGMMVGFEVNAGANAVNDAGQVTGRHLNAVYEAYRWDATDMMRTDLGHLGDKPTNLSFTAAINQAGDVVGASLVDSGQYHAFLWQEGSGMLDLGTLGSASNTSVALGVNDTGQVVGHSSDDEVHTHACLWQGGELLDLGYLGADAANISHANDVNDAGVIVGYSDTGLGGGNHAFIWTLARGMVDLNTVLEPGATSESLDDAPAINEVGQIIINTRAGHTLLLTPSQWPYDD